MLGCELFESSFWTSLRLKFSVHNRLSEYRALDEIIRNVCRYRQARDNNIVLRLWIRFWIIMATYNTHITYYLIIFHAGIITWTLLRFTLQYITCLFVYYTESEEKQSNVWYLSRLRIISSSGTTDCIDEYIQLSGMSKIAEVVFHILRQCLHAELLPSVDDSPYWQWSAAQSTN